MGMTKNYLLKILENCSEHQFGQDAVEWAIVSGWITLTGDLQTDLKTIMGEPNTCPRCHALNVPDSLKCDECGDDLPTPKFPGQYDAICEAYRRMRDELNQQSMDALHPLFEEILRPMPGRGSASLAQRIP